METQPRRKLWHLLVTPSSFVGLSYLLTFHKSFLHWVTDWIHWCPTSFELFEQAEAKIFTYLKKPHKLHFVPITGIGGDKSECKIRSLIINKDAEKKATPVVLLHGFASGIGLWILNLDSLSKDRPLYALDILGFGRSSRPVYSKNAEIAEYQMVESIEQWRTQIGLNQFILLGHSLGAFLAASYAIKYPDKVKHLILVDPWGFSNPDQAINTKDVPVYIKVFASMLKPFNPLSALRAAGPLGPFSIRFRRDILGKFEDITDVSDVASYIYHCNAQYPSGEAAFKTMSAPFSWSKPFTLPFGWSKRPLINRISHLMPDIPISFIYGSRSWIDNSSGPQIRSIRKHSYVDIKVIQGAGHLVYADRADVFNRIVCDICMRVDETESCSQMSGCDGKQNIVTDGIITQDADEDKPCVFNTM